MSHKKSPLINIGVFHEHSMNDINEHINIVSVLQRMPWEVLEACVNRKDLGYRRLWQVKESTDNRE